MPTTKKIAQSLLLALSAIGFYGTWYLVINNGTQALMKDVRDNGPHILPGTEEPLLQSYTGIRAVDYQLTVLDLFFWESIDGSRPHTSLFVYHFGGQILAAWPLLLAESLRKGNEWKAISFSALWGIVIQNLSYAVIMPIYLVVHLSTSVSQNVNDILIDPSSILSIAPAMCLGYILPSALMALPAPTVLSYNNKQRALAIWQFFPVFVSICLQLSSSVLRRTSKVQGSPRNYSITLARNLYTACLFLAIFSQLSTFSIIAFPNLFSSLISPKHNQSISFSSVFVPATISPSVKMDRIGDGVHLLFQYDQYIGSVAITVWAIALYLDARRNCDTMMGTWRMTAWSLLILMSGGPIGVAIFFIWCRDEIMFRQQRFDDAKHANKKEILIMKQ